MMHYTGHVFANPAGPDGKRLRCEFQLLRADEGMKDGGEARCQQPSGKTIKADSPILKEYQKKLRPGYHRVTTIKFERPMEMI
jgi:hypothetical protein